MITCRLFIFILLLFAHRTLAQTDKKFWVGPKAGINLTQIVGKSTGSSKLVPHATLGLTTEYRFKGTVALSGDVAYNRLGGRYKFNSGSLQGQYLVNTFDYITVPVLLRFSPRKSPLFVEAGGQIGLFLSRRILLGNLGSAQTSQNQSLDKGWTVGVGSTLTKHLGLNVRYYRGITPIFPSYYYTDPQTGHSIRIPVQKLYHQSLGLQLAYYF